MKRPHFVGGDGLQVWKSAALMRHTQTGKPDRVGSNKHERKDVS